jgi:hypothetical protein
MQHHWPTWELLSNIAHSHKNVVLSPAEFICQQLLIMNPATLPLWFGGLVWLFASRDARRYAVLGFAYLFTLLEFIVMHGKNYYLAPAYPMLFAAGWSRSRAFVCHSLAMDQAGSTFRYPSCRDAFRSGSIADSAPIPTGCLHEGDSFPATTYGDFAHGSTAPIFR